MTFRAFVYWFFFSCAITENVVLKSKTVIVYLSSSTYWFCIYITYIEVLLLNTFICNYYIFDSLTFISLWSVALPLVILFVLRSILLDVNIATPAYFCLILHGISFHHFTFKLFVSLYWKWDLYWEHVVAPGFLNKVWQFLPFNLSI